MVWPGQTKTMKPAIKEVKNVSTKTKLKIKTAQPKIESTKLADSSSGDNDAMMNNYIFRKNLNYHLL